MSINVRWLILRQHRTTLAFVLLSIFHAIFGMTLWSLVVCAGRGPGAVGERMNEVTLTSASGSHRGRGSQDERDLEGGEEAPLMPAEQSAEDNASGPPQHRRRRRRRKQGSGTASAGRYSPAVTEEDPEEAGASDHLEMRPSSSSEDEDDGDDSETIYGPEAGAKVQVIYPSQRDAPQQQHEAGSGTLMAKANGKVRFCRKVSLLRACNTSRRAVATCRTNSSNCPSHAQCNLVKPDRAHHCSTCGYCILKMDHHCPWLGGCVGFANYKPFILFLIYAAQLAIFAGSVSLWSLVQVLDVDLEELGLAPLGWGFMILFGFLFSLMLSGFAPYHLYLACNNRTTIENMERNGRLLSLPPKAESMLAAGTADPILASLPEHSVAGAGQHLLADSSRAPNPFLEEQQQHAHSTGGRANPFLPASTRFDEHSSVINAQPTFAGPSASSSNYPFNLTSQAILTRQARRALEKQAGQINIYDLGLSSRNFEQAFGSKWYQPRSWIPVGRGLGSGYAWPVNRAKLEKLRRINTELRKSRDGGI